MHQGAEGKMADKEDKDKEKMVEEKKSEKGKREWVNKSEGSQGGNGDSTALPSGSCQPSFCRLFTRSTVKIQQINHPLQIPLLLFNKRL